MHHPDTPPLPLTQAVAEVFPALAGSGWRALRGGRTNRLWRLGDLVIKLYRPDAASPLFPNDLQAEVAALRLLGPPGLSPTLRHSGDGWLAYDFSPAQPWPGGDPAPVARALAVIHARDGACFRVLPSGSAALLHQARRIAALCLGTLPPAPPDPGIAPARPRLIHGDAVAGNVLVNAESVTLIDWQCPANGDPAEDLAAFLSPAMQWLYRGQILDYKEENAFLSAYPSRETVARFHSLRPLFRWRMAAHCLWKAEQGAEDYRKALAVELGWRCSRG